MISNKKYKLSEIAKDFGLKNNDLVNLLKAHSGGAAVHTSAIDEDDFAVIFEVLTSENQIVGLEDYLAGKTDVLPEHRSKPEEPKKEEKAEEKPEDKKPEDKKAPEEKTQKEEKTPEEKKPEDKKPEKQETKKQEQAQPEQKQSRVDQFRRQQQQQQKAKQPEKKPTERERQSKIITVTGGGSDGSSTSKTGKKTRIIDTRSASVDLGKYDEKLNSYISDKDDNYSKDRQKIKKKNTQQQEKGTKAKTEREKEIERKEKKKREVFENAKNTQLHVQIPDAITVGELASRLKVTAAEVVKRLMMMGSMLTVNDVVDYDTAYLIADDLGVAVSKEVVVTIEEKLFTEVEDKPEQLKPRAPVVCVMGHVDHGKTSLLDAIRHTQVTKGEAGGITQHIGSYRVKINGRDITFLDTPGHEAFTAMRLRGAMATDIAVIVVAADDGIMPQTVEAINHAKAAGVTIIIAINKMDKPYANPEQIKQELTKYDLVPEEWGGDTICVPVSALTGMGLEDLLENILLVADVKELKANPDRAAKGIVIESRLDRGRGPVATVLVQNGTLHAGDTVIAGTAVGRIRAMKNDRGENVKSAGPSVPVEIIGLSDVPTAGDGFDAVADEKMARELAEQRKAKEKEAELGSRTRATLEDFMSDERAGTKILNLIVKADVGGSAEAVTASLSKLVNEEVRVKIIHKAVGGITESDVMLAAASEAIIIGFNVTADRTARESAKLQGVEIRTYTVIYDCINDVEAAMKGMLAPKYREAIIGHAEVRQTIHVPNVGTIAGSYILDGKVTNKSLIRVLRDSVIIFEDKVSSLKRFKDDVKEVNSGYECGIGLDKFNDIRVGDILESYIIEEIQR